MDLLNPLFKGRVEHLDASNAFPMKSKSCGIASCPNSDHKGYNMKPNLGKQSHGKKRFLEGSYLVKELRKTLSPFKLAFLAIKLVEINLVGQRER